MNIQDFGQTDLILAGTAFEIIRRTFSESGTQDRKSFRLKNLTRSEALQFLRIWEAGAASSGLEDVRVVVASDAGEEFPARYRAEPEHSITYYRNNNTDGLVYIETKVESDEQGLKNIFTLRDVNFLDGTFDREGFRVPEVMVRLAILEAGKSEPTHYSLFSQRCLEVLTSIQAGGVTLPVRKFVKFVRQAAIELAGSGVLDSTETDALVGRNLRHLDMFPDALWRREPGRVPRRLYLNLLRAELASSASSDLDPEKLVEECKRTLFLDEDGQEYGPEDQQAWRQLCSEYCLDPDVEKRARIPYRIFEQLFEKDVKGLKLGDRVEQEIAQQSPERLAEFEDLGVKDGLDRRSRDDAQRFLDAEPEDEEISALRDILRPQTRRMVEKVAAPVAERIDNPLVKLAQVARLFRERNDLGEEAHRLEMRIGRGVDESSPTTGLLAFVYGATLAEIAESTRDSLTGFSLVVSRELLDAGSPPDVVLPPGEDEEDDTELVERIEWKPLPIEFVLSRVADGHELDSEAAIEWCPENLEHLALLWIAACAMDRGDVDQELHAPPSANGHDWISAVSGRESPLCREDAPRIAKRTLENSTISALVELRRSFRASAESDGLSADLLNDIFDRWQTLLGEARRDFVPDGSPDDRMRAFLNADCVLGFGGDGILMLATHPLRLRWIAAYLAKSKELAERALLGTLSLNASNENFYLGWISRLSPHQQPAIHSSSGGTLLFASGEAGWSEHFRPDIAAGGAMVGQRVAPSIVSEIVRQVERYLHAHPYKVDGLSILLVTTDGTSLAASLVDAVRRRDFRNIRMKIELVAPKTTWPEAARQFENVDTENRLRAGGALLPPVELRLHDLEETAADVEKTLDELNCDIAVIPEFLKEGVHPQEKTRPESSELGSFNALLDQPTFIKVGAGGESVSVSLLPAAADVSLSSWSTLVVRNKRQYPVSPETPQNTDFMDLIVRFHDAARLFEKLHERAHWVVTVERHVTREQIERLESRPDILVVRDKIGPGGLFTLIVSSNSGRKFIVARLERKIAHISERFDPAHSQAELHDLATRIYDDTRKIAPRLTLEALGVSRVSEEILGLAVARRLAEQFVPTATSNGLVAWISLDEHPEWFSGSNATRADMLRVALNRTEDGLEVELLVLESKLRQSGFDAHGADQVRTTLALLDSIFREREGEDIPLDAELWRESILSAMETLSPEALTIRGASDGQPEVGTRVPHDLREDFRTGRFKLKSIRGLYSICSYGQSGEIGTEVDSKDERLTIVRSTGAELVAAEPAESAPVAAPEQELVLGPEQMKETERGLQETAEPDAEAGKAREQSGSGETRHTAGGGAESAGHRPTTDLEPTSGTDLPQERKDLPRGKLSRAELETRYQLILDSYAQFGISVRKAYEDVEPFIEGPASVLYRIRPDTGVDPRRIIEKSDSLKLALRLSEEQQIRFSIDKGHITIDVPKSDEDRYYVDAVDLWSRWERPPSELAIPLGEDRFGRVVQINFSSSNSPHLLIGGTTGSGKSEALNTILAGLTRHYPPEELRLLLIDPKGTELEHLSGSPHLWGSEIGWTDDDASSLLENAVAEMQRRYELFKTARARSISEFNEKADSEQRIPWWMIVLDEYADLTSDPDAKKAIEAHLKRLAQKARAAGIHVVIATQKPSGEVISTNLRSNLPAQIALRVKSGTESRVVMDETGAETLAGKGDAFLKSEGRLVRVQCGKVDFEALATM